MALAESAFPPLLLLVSGPAGSGKTTLCEGLLDAFSRPATQFFSNGLKRVITATTRSPRDNERHGVDYYFLTADEFKSRVQNNEFYEHAEVYQQHYGTLKSEVHEGLESGLDLLLNVDVQGAATFREAASREPALSERLISVFIAPSSIEELRARLIDRGQNEPDDLEHRLEIASEEIKQRRFYDYVIPSGSRERDLQALTSIFTAEKLKSSRL
jgi:guanylate kinase